MRILILAVLLAGSVSAHGLEVYGAGAESCGKWIEFSKNQLMRYNLNQWVLGFVSAASLFDGAKKLGFESGELAETDSNAVGVWMDNYCRENPLDTIMLAAGVLVGELAERADK